MNSRVKSNLLSLFAAVAVFSLGLGCAEKGNSVVEQNPEISSEEQLEKYEEEMMPPEGI